MDTARRGNYESGSDYVLEYGELRFTFNERDFTERVEQAACKLGFVDGSLGDDEREDLVNLAVNGEVHEPQSDLGDHINDRWGDLNGPSERSLVHWIRRLVFRRRTFVQLITFITFVGPILFIISRSIILVRAIVHTSRSMREVGRRLRG